ncbi:discoidin domain-containing receptor 2-like isoform X2 [Clytia hemisphaerica]|uniref:Uncharacterized protein n=1 Tax=Clytia hemisphaerica TaxID=252671 RepID=A0A7M6DQC2_9CNID
MHHFIATITLALVFFFSGCYGDKIKPQDPVCNQPLGLEDGSIKNSQLTTPSGGTTGGKEGFYARLNNDEAWCIPQLKSSEDVFRDKVYLEIDLGQEKSIRALALQGYKQYGYGDKIRFYYDMGGVFGIHSEIDVGNKKYSEMEYVVLDQPITARTIRIMLQSGSNVKCLRAELYGCGSYRRNIEYYQCPNTNEELMTSALKTQGNTKYITETSFLSSTGTFTGEHLLFSEAYAWCVQKDQQPLQMYSEYAEVNLKEDYLIYGVKVDGFRSTIGQPSDNNLAKNFKIEYGVLFDNKIKWVSYRANTILDSSSYRTDALSTSPPLVAQYVRIYMKVNDTKINCIKLQLYGCKASLTPSRIVLYQIPKGQEPWTDVKYSGKINSDGVRNGGLGCLVDGKAVSGINPVKSPYCWIGWNKANTSKPFIKLELTRKTTITGVQLRVYVDKAIKASTAMKFTVRTTPHFGVLPDYTGYVCAPDSYYQLSEEFFIDLDLGSVQAQFIDIFLEYSEELILLRQVTLKQGQLSGSALKLSQTPEKCIVPIFEERTGGGADDSSKIIIIVCIVLGLLLLAVVGFVIYHYRTSLHKKFKSHARHDQLLVERKTQNGNGKRYVQGNGYGQLGRHSPQVSYKGGHHDHDMEQVYAAPEVAVSVSESSLDGNASQYAQYNTINDHADSNPSLYAAPNTKQYAEPDQKPEIYQSSAIYATTYKNPYQSVAPSTLVYADPAKVVSSKLPPSLRSFPREQLAFREKIGVGQFGEVHIAEATGLDDIYGTIGHYNSWGLPDTANVAVKVLKSDDAMIEEEFLKEVTVMAELKHENVVRLLGVCEDKPMIMVCEYMENGDLNQYLRQKRPIDEHNIRASMLPDDALSVDTLIHMAQQIAAGMKYLHAEGFIHRDLATRNCLVGAAFQVKIADFGLSRSLYEKQYYRVEGKAVLPIRWMAPECLYYGTFKNPTDIWSFGVTLWEIFSFARESPYSELTDLQIIEAACESVQHPDREFVFRLEQPATCPDEVYRLMLKCWNKNPDNRPPFAFLNRQFMQLNTSSEGDI